MRSLPGQFARIFAGVAVPVLLLMCFAAAAQRADSSQDAREQMVQKEVVGRGVRDPRVCSAMREVPRHLFVPANMRKYAYTDAAIPIGHGQTITSPFVVAYMTEQLAPQPQDKVLEIGTGSGYQASVLSRLVANVYTIEIVEPLGRRSAATIQRLGYDNVHAKIGDGYQGWPEQAPFDKIIVTCSPENVPPALVEQLKEGGRLVVPLGERFQQSLFLFRKVDGQLQKEKLESTFFVPMTGQAEEMRTRKDESGIPRIVNGSFEIQDPTSEVPGWFYVRQAKVVADPSTGAGSHVLLLSNSQLGQNAHALQPVGLDGRKLRSVDMSVRVRTRGIASGTNEKWLPRVELSFYDENRELIRSAVLGPWAGSAAWFQENRELPIPGRARLAVVVIGMFGATGEIALDDIQISATPERR